MITKISVAAFAVMMLISAVASAQVTFQKSYGGISLDVANAVKQTSDGGYIIIGSTMNYGAGSQDVYLVKTDANGDTLWTRTYGGASDDIGSAVEQTNDGGYIIAGYTYGFGAGMTDAYVIKTTASGDTMWTKTYGGSDVDYGNSIKQTSDGGYIIAGSTQSFTSAYDEAYLIKTDANGDTTWTRTFGGPGEDGGSSVIQTSDDGYVLTGTWDEASNFEVYLVKTNAAGTMLWSKTYGGEAADIGTAVEETADGGLIIAGGANSFSPNHTTDFYLIKTDALGDTAWTKTYGGSSYDRAQSVQQTIDGGYIVGGLILDCANCPSDLYMIRTDAAGDTVWTKRYGGSFEDPGVGGSQTADGGFIATGWSMSFGAGSYDMYLIKTDANGNSGCNESVAATTLVSTPHTIVSIPATTTLSGCIVNNAATAVANGGTVTTSCTSVSVEAISNYFSLLGYPNPFTNDLVVSGTAANGELILCDVLGKEILRQKTFDKITKIDSRDLHPGFYLLTYIERNKSEKISVLKF